ncbi:hypothetical protein GLOTRDRAFT_53842 [Gloeophyllum trabeum ATCC 11539]|uniref:Actin cortical patch SUR7/pH-response regulator pali n=1 Tax=Gloeophyllum trabeum (strain ATCC 11539 / FP-39264 / Madison 617) TaxID=670483 RepID=S7QP60_GLOTA|nr:uncharacterized protein GLOTRDRAFT_53842 [Gloeophyllum trabeum ATCC 11539]EPQ61097.1 hypothetical protein GLOTRDRAFT_53842 [Gloeophyllum trabeum ATCC 11539]
MRGEICIGSASFLSFVALLLCIFMHVGQINTSTIPRGIAMAKVNVSGYGNALYAALGDPIQGLYASNASAPLGAEAGLRNFYDYGLYSYCAYLEPPQGICSNHSTANRFEPFTAMTSDMIGNWSFITEGLIPSVSFRNSGSLGSQSNSAYYLLLLGTICAGLAFLLGMAKQTITFLASSILAILGSIFLLAGAAIWTAVVHKAASVNDLVVGSSSSPTPLGITISVGNGIYLAWAAFACLVVSILPYMTSCCTYRG